MISSLNGLIRPVEISNDLQLTIHVPIKLTSTLEGDLIIKITKVKPGLHISHKAWSPYKDRKHIVANTFFELPGMPWSSHK